MPPPLGPDVGVCALLMGDGDGACIEEAVLSLDKDVFVILEGDGDVTSTDEVDGRATRGGRVK